MKDLEPGWDDLSRFGIIETDDESRITGFEEKPENPKTNTVSTGIYVMRRRHLISELERCAEEGRWGKSMSSLRIAENIMHLRKKKGITQDELASFLGVTKASVSKWENGQSMPDIMLLPEIATYFDITVDALLGYEP